MPAPSFVFAIGVMHCSAFVASWFRDESGSGRVTVLPELLKLLLYRFSILAVHIWVAYYHERCPWGFEGKSQCKLVEAIGDRAQPRSMSCILIPLFGEARTAILADLRLYAIVWGALLLFKTWRASSHKQQYTTKIARAFMNCVPRHISHGIRTPGLIYLSYYAFALCHRSCRSFGRFQACSCDGSRRWTRRTIGTPEYD